MVSALEQAAASEWCQYVYFPFICNLADIKKRKSFWRFISANVNISMDIVAQNSTKPWDFEGLSSNPNLTFAFILSNPSKKWNWQKISRNPGITMDDIKSRISRSWDYGRHGVSSNPNLTLAMVLAYPKKKWDWEGISCNNAIRLVEDIVEHRELPWNWYRGVSGKRGLTIDMVLDPISPSIGMINLSTVCHAGGITMNDIRQHPEVPWIWSSGVSNHRELSIDILLEFPAENWGWEYVSKHSGITMDDIRAHPELPWSWVGVSAHTELTLEMVLEFPDKPWNWQRISMNPAISMADLLANPSLPWDFTYWGLSCNPNLNLETLLIFPTKPWSWSTIGQTESDISMADISQHNNSSLPWAECICTTSFKVEKQAYIYRKCCRFALLSLMDEDYSREEGVLNRSNAVDMVFQSELIASIMIKYL